MAEKDITEKILEAYNDVFADIVNNLLFNGEHIIDENDLEDAQPFSMYKADGKIHENERDVAKFWKKAKIILSLLGFENQTEYDPDVPLRTIGYDGAGYRAQLLRVDKNGKKIISKERYPVITIVLYFGNTHWNKNRTLKERLTFPAGMEDLIMPYFNDYKVNLFEIAFLPEEKLPDFKSDFRIVAEYFIKSRKYPEYVPDAVVMRHIDEVLKTLSALTGDRRFEDVLVSANEEGVKHTMMNDYMSRLYQRGVAEGEARGKVKGKAEGKAEAYTFSIWSVMNSFGVTAEQAMKSLAIPEDEYEKYLRLVKEKYMN